MYNHKQFLDSFFDQIKKSGLDINGLDLDHIAYQASSPKDYDKLRVEFQKFGPEISQEIIGQRRVAVYKLTQPIKYQHYSIPALELIEPKQGQQCDSAFQHAEFVIKKNFEYYLEEYPNINWDTSSLNRDEFAHLKINFDNGLTLKFLKAPILELVTSVIISKSK